MEVLGGLSDLAPNVRGHEMLVPRLIVTFSRVLESGRSDSEIHSVYALVL